MEFSCVPYKLCKGVEYAFPQVHLANLAVALFVLIIRRNGPPAPTISTLIGERYWLTAEQGRVNDISLGNSNDDDHASKFLPSEPLILPVDSA